MPLLLDPASLRDGPRLAASQVKGHRRIMVIRALLTLHGLPPGSRRAMTTPGGGQGQPVPGCQPSALVMALSATRPGRRARPPRRVPPVPAAAVVGTQAGHSALPETGHDGAVHGADQQPPPARRRRGGAAQQGEQLAQRPGPEPAPRLGHRGHGRSGRQPAQSRDQAVPDLGVAQLGEQAPRQQQVHHHAGREIADPALDPAHAHASVRAYASRAGQPGWSRCERGGRSPRADCGSRRARRAAAREERERSCRTATVCHRVNLS